MDWDGEFRLFQGIHARIDIKIDISISIRLMITTFGKEVYLQALAQMKLTKQVLVRSSRQGHVTN